jgi:transcriptional regulator with XRE-family HTH domain
MAKAGKSGVFEKSPNTQTTKFGGKFINISALARSLNMDISYLSRILRGSRVPKLSICKNIAAMMGMTLDEFSEALEVRQNEVEEHESTLVKKYEERIAREDKADLATYQRGKVPAPRLPSTR